MADEDGALLPAPPTPMLDLMRKHLREEHGYKVLRLARDLYLGGERKKGQHLSWNPTTESFRCDLCPGQVFSTGSISPERIRTAQIYDPVLRSHLPGLADQADRDERTRHHLDGSANREELRRLQGADAKRRRAKGTRPTVDQRRELMQAWLIGQVKTNGGNLERALEKAERLQQEDPEAWAHICDRPLAKGTLRDYWQDIPPEELEAAFSEGKNRAEKSTH